MDKLLRTRFFSLMIVVITFLFLLYMIWLVQPVLAVLADMAGEVFLPFLLGVVMAYILHPIVDVLERRKMPRAVAVFLIFLTFLLVVAVALLHAIPVFYKQLLQLADDVPRLTQWYESWLREWESNKYFLPDTIQIGVDRVILQSKERMSQEISNLVTNAHHSLGKLLGYMVVPFIAYYFLKDMRAINKTCMLFVPPRYRKQAFILFRDINDALGKYIHGQILVALIVGGMAYVGYWLIGMPYPFVLALFVSVTNIIPFIGPLIGAIPAILVAFTISFQTVLWVILVNTIVQVLEGNILSPNIVGRTLHLHPLLIIFALLAGEAVAGIVGMIVSVPLIAVLKVAISRVAMMARES